MYKLVCIMGESGSGKTTIEKELVSSGLFMKLVSMTTRPIREGEIDEEDYYFVSDLKFQKYVMEDLMVEHTEYGTKETTGIAFKYGIDKNEIEKLEQSPCIVVVTPDGFEKMRDYVGENNVIPIYLKTDSDKRLKKTFERYAMAADEYEAEILRRLEGDKVTFKDVNKINNLITLTNDYTRESFINNLKTIVDSVFFVHDRSKMINE